MSYRDIAKAQLKVDEGSRSKPYRDTVGKLTVGVGRNLDDVGLRDTEIDLLLSNDLEMLFQSFDNLSDSRKAVILNMAFNMGQQRLAGFLKFRAAVDAGDYDGASREMLSSVWASQVGNRAVRLATMMRQG